MRGGNPRPDSPRLASWDKTKKVVEETFPRRLWGSSKERKGMTPQEYSGWLAGRMIALVEGMHKGYRFAQIEIAQALYGAGENGMTQAEVAVAVGVSQATVSRLLKDTVESDDE